MSPLLIWEFLIWEAVPSLFEDLAIEGVTKKLISKEEICGQEYHKSKEKKDHCYLQGNQITYSIILRISTTITLSILYHVTL